MSAPLHRSPHGLVFGLAGLMLGGLLSAQAATDTWSGSVSSTWDTTSLNWNSGASAFTSGDNALFSGTPTRNVMLATGLTIGTITLDSTFTGSVLLTGPNTVNGATSISAGTLTLTNATALGTSAVTVNSPGLLWLESLGAGLTYANNVSGTGTIKVSPGTDTLQMSGDLSGFTGILDVFKGPSTWGKLAFSGGSQAKTIASSATIKLESGATLYLNQAYNYNATVQVNGGTTLEAFGNLRIETGAVQAGPVTLFANSTIGVNAGAGTISGVISESGGSYGFTKLGGSTLTNSGANTYSGKTLIQGGTLAVNSLNKVSGGTASSGLGAPTTAANGTIDMGAGGTGVTLNYLGVGETSDRVINLAGTTGGATLQNSGAGLLKFTSDLTATGGGSKTLTLGGATGTGEIAGNIPNNSSANLTALTKTGANTWTISAATNTFTGQLQVNGGTLNWNSAATLAPNATYKPLDIRTGGILNVNGLLRYTSGSSGNVFAYLNLGWSGAGNIGTIIINSGGNLTFTNQTSNPNSIVGQLGTGGTSMLIVNGGTFNWDPTGGLIFGNGNGSGLLLITNGGTATILKGTGNIEEGYIELGRNSLTSTGTVYLAHGTLATDRGIAVGVTTPIGVGYVYFDGGTLKALANQSDWMQAAVNGNIYPPNAVTIADGGAIIDANGFSVTINNNLLHGGVAATDGGVTKLSAGTLTLGGTGHTYTGPTIVSNGVLAVTGSLPAASAVTVAGGKLTVSGSVGGTVTVQPGGAVGASSGTFSSLVTLNAGNSAINLQDGAATTTTFANGLTLNNGNVLSFDLGSSSDQIYVPGTFTYSGTVTINLAAISGVSAGTPYTIITDGAADINSTTGFVIGTVPTGYSAALSTSGGALQVTLSQSAPATAYWKGGLDNKWNTTSGGNANWTSDAGGTINTVVPPGTPTAVTFAASGAGNFNTVLGADFSINNLTLSTANNVTIGGPTNTLTIVAGLLNDTTALNNSLTVSNVVLASPQTWQNNSANPLRVNSAISGADLTVAGSGAIILANTNNAPASTTVSGGTLQLGDGAAQNGAVSGNIANNSVVTFANPTAQTFSGAISGTGQLIKTGSGTLTLPVDNTYGSGTTISNGTLEIVTANGASSGAIAIESGAALVCQPTTTTTYPNTVTGTGLVKLLFGSEGLGYNNQGDWFTHLDNLSGFTGTIQLSATTSTNVDKWAVDTASVNATSSLIIDSGAQLYLSGGNSLTFSSIQVSGFGNYQNRGAIRAASGTLTGPMSLLGNTTFGTEGGTIAGTIASGAIGTQTLTLGGTADLGGGSITVSADIGGGTGTIVLNKINTGTTTLSGNNTFTGPTTNSAGTLTLANGSALQNSTLTLAAGSLVFDSSVSSNAFVLGGLTGTANISLANNAGGAISLAIGNNGSSTTYSGALNDNNAGSSLTKVGNGTLTLAGALNYTGTTTVQGGTLGISTLLTNATAGVSVNDGATLVITVNGTNQIAPASYTLAASTVATNGFNGLNSTIFAPVNAGTLTVNGTITVNIGGGTFAAGNTYPLIAFTSITGSGGFVMGSMPRGMTAASIVTNGNTIALNVTGFAKSVDLWTGNVNTNWDSGTTNWLVSGTPNIYLDGEYARFDDSSVQTNVYVTTVVQPLSTVVSNTAETYTFTGTGIGGTGGLIKQGAGTLVLAQANTYTGNTVISNGTLQVGAGGTTGSLGAGDVMDNAALSFNLNANVSVANNVSGTGTVMVGGGNRLHFSGTHTESGSTTINSGSILEINAVSGYSSNSDYTVNGVLEAYNNNYLPSATIGALNGSGTVYNTASSAGTTEFILGANGSSGNFYGVIADHAWGANVTALTKIGTGTQTLNGINTYSGATTVNEGTLLVDGSTAAGAVTVNGGTLGGSGTLHGAVTVNSGATLAPGDGGIGSLTISGNITLNAGSTNTFEVNGSTLAHDSVVAGGAVTYGGELNIVPSGSFTAGQNFTLFSGTGATNTSNFATITGSPGSGLLFSFTNGVLSVVTAGPSGPGQLTNSVSGGVLSLSWPAGQGWRLQMQTNSLSAGLNTNWVYITDGSISSTNITVDPTQPTAFYRLRYP